MKLKALLLTLLVAGFVTSIAVAGPPPGKGKDKTGKKSGAPALTATTTTAGATTGATTTTTSTTGKAGKVLLCHRTGSKKNPFVLIQISAKAAAKRIKKGDFPPAANGTCSTTTTTGTTTTGTTQTTTTATTTTTTA